MLQTLPRLRRHRNLAHKRQYSTMSNETYASALTRLFSLQSNAAVVEQWKNERRANHNASLKPEIMSYLRRLDVDLKALSSGAIHVAGTKGKGSTCAFVESIIRHHGYSTGLFTSPHLIEVRERIKMNGKPISEELFAKYFWECYNTLKATTTEEEPWEPSFFKFLTVMALKIFSEEKIQCTILEVGIGGRTDSTNVFDSLVSCGISTLDYDHMAVLGDTLADIAREKSGIFKASVPGITVPQVEEGQRVVISEAKRHGTPLFITSPWQQYADESKEQNILGLRGNFQYVNASLAVALAHIWLQKQKGEPFCAPEIFEKDEWPVPFPVFALSSQFIAGLKNCQWPGRAQTIEGFREHNNVTFYIDGAHTPASIHSCFEWFEGVEPPNPSTGLLPTLHLTLLDKEFVLVFNCKSNKDANVLLGHVVSHTSKYPFQSILFSSPSVLGSKNNPPPPAAVPGSSEQDALKTIYLALRKKSEESTQTNVFFSVNSCLDEIDAIATQNEHKKVVVFVTGSLYLVGGVLEALQFKVE